MCILMIRELNCETKERLQDKDGCYSLGLDVPPVPDADIGGSFSELAEARVCEDRIRAGY